MPYLVMHRSDIDDGLLQVLDLKPNTSQRSFIYDPPGQTKYLRYPDNETVATSGSGPIVTTSEAKGLAAYLIDHVENTGGGGQALTAAEAIAIAAAIITEAQSGNDLALADINTLINAETGVSGSDLDGTLGDSTGTVAEVMQILAGAEYTLPSGSTVEDGSNDFVATEAGSFTTGQYRQTYDGIALRLSFSEGVLSDLVSATYSYGGTAGAACTVYADDGTIYTA